MTSVLVEPVTDYSSVDFSTHVILQSNDDPSVDYPVSRDAAKMSGLIKDLLDEQVDGTETKVPLPNVNGKVLKYIIQYMEHHWNNRTEPFEKPLKANISELISEWDRKFLYENLIKDGDEKNHELLIQCIMGANFLNIRDLLDLTCASVATMIKGKSTEQIRELFNIVNDFTPEEEAKVREENKWCEES